MNRFILVTCFVVILAGCSSKLAYNNLDWVAYWYVADYIELSDQQERAVKQQLAEVLEWHRNTELAKYKDELLEIQSLIEQGQIERVDWADVLDFVRSSWYSIREQVVVRLLPLIPSLEEEQVDDLFEALEANNKEKIDGISTVPDGRFAQRFERLVERLESFIGGLTEEQRLLVELNIGASFDTRRQYLEANKAMQRDLKRLLHQYLTSKSPKQLAKIGEVLRAPEVYRSKQFKVYSEENKALVVSLLHDLALSLTDDQRSHLLEKVRDWCRLIDALIQNKKSPPKELGRLRSHNPLPSLV